METDGDEGLTYQWYKDDDPISNAGSVSGASTYELLISGVLSSDEGDCHVVASNAGGSLSSSTATLTTTSP